jgi:hypothetical protein
MNRDLPNAYRKRTDTKTLACMLLLAGVIALPRPAHAQRLCEVIGICHDFTGSTPTTIGPPRPDLIPGIIRNIPQTIEDLPGTATGLSAAIRLSKSRAAQGARPIPVPIRAELSAFFDRALLDRVRYSTDWGAAANGTLQQFILGNGHAVAVTLDDVIVFQSPTDAMDDVLLWAHELGHVEQYQRMGIDSFASRVVTAYWTVENEAKNRANGVAGRRTNVPYTFCATPAGNSAVIAGGTPGSGCWMMDPWGRQIFGTVQAAR